MQQAVTMVGLLTLTLVASFGVAYFATRMRRRTLPLVPLSPGDSARVVGPGGVARCRFVEADKKGLVFTDPIQTKCSTEFKVGETVMVQAPVADSIVTFRAEILSHDSDAGQFRVSYPERVRHVDRRSEDRDTSMAGSIVRLNDRPASIENLSASGARVLVSTPVKPGDVVCLELPDGIGEVYGWALEAVPSASGNSSSRSVRVRFDEPLAGLSSAPRRRSTLQ